jgi:DNA-binding SARP family transcriptional activator
VLHLTLLGGFSARCDDGAPIVFARKKAQALLAYLALHADRAHPRDKLATLLWADLPDSAARHNLRQTLLVINGALPAKPATVVAGIDTVAIEKAGMRCDAVEFARLAVGDTPDALAAAADLYRGDLLAGLPPQSPAFEQWLVAERARLHELAAESLAKLLSRQMRQQETEAAIRTALRLLAIDTSQEAVHRTLMRLYMRVGRRGAALRQYQECARTLERELDTEPEEQTRRLYREILQTGSGGAGSAEAPAPDGLAATAAVAFEARLIGREAELAWLTRARADAGRGRGHVAIVAGEAGIGKTRLVTEIVAPAGDGSMTVIVGRAWETGQVLPFGPWIEAFRAAGLVSGPAAPELPAIWRRELARLFPELGRTSSRLADGAEEHLRVFEAVVQLIARAAAQRPLLIVLEDLHWADAMSARLLSFVGRRLAEHPVLLVVTARDEELAPAPVVRQALAELEGAGHAHRLALGPLSREQTQSLVEDVSAPALDRAMKQRLAEHVWRASEGNPFVAVETARAARERGLTPGAPLVPERVRELIISRTERLGAGARDLVALAAVIGRAFDFTLLNAAADLDAEATAGTVEELVGRRLLHVVGEQLEFTHERIREVVYSTLLPPRRRLLHARTVAALEAVYANDLEPHYAALVGHARAGEVWDKTVDHLVRFAKRAARSFAHAEAVAALEEALVLTERLPAEAREAAKLEIVAPLVRSLFFVNRSGDARDLLLAQQARVESVGNPWFTGRFYLLLAMTYFSLGESATTEHCARRAIAEAEQCDDVSTVGKASYILCGESFWPGRFVEGVAHGRRAVECLEKSNEPGWLALAWWILGVNYAGLGEFRAALDAEERAFAMAEPLGDPRVQALASWFSGVVHVMRGETDAAIESCRRAVDLAPDHLNRTLASGFLGYAYLRAEDLARAVPLIEQFLAELGQSWWPQYRGWFTTFLAEARLTTGDLDAARALAAEGLVLTTDARYSFGIAWAQRTLGWVLRASGDRAEAERCVRQAFDTFEGTGSRNGMAYIHLDLAVLAHDRADAAEARRHLDLARGLFTALDAPRYVARADALAEQLFGTSPAVTDV